MKTPMEQSDNAQLNPKEFPHLGSTPKDRDIPRFTFRVSRITSGFSHNSAFIMLALAAATLAVYWPVRHFDFVNYDDGEGVLRCAMIRQGLTWPGVAWAFLNRHMGNWQPLTSISYMWDAELCHLDPAWPHVENVLFHVANTLLLFVLLKSMTGARWRSAFVAALFALHPLHVESVAWVSERKDVLSTFFFMLTLMAYVEYVTFQTTKCTKTEEAGKAVSASTSPFRVFRVFRGSALFWYVAALFLFALGLMSKPMLVTVPCVLLLLDYWPFDRYHSGDSPNLQSPPSVQGSRFKVQGSRFVFLVLEKIPFFALALAMCCITIIAQERSGAVAELSVVPMHSRLENVLVSYARYIQKMVWPCDLVAHYPRVLDWPLWSLGAAAALLGAITLAALWTWRSRPYLIFGWLWFLGTLVPVIGLVQVGTQSMADRYTYIPLIGLFITVAWGIADVCGTAPLSKRTSHVVPCSKSEISGPDGPPRPATGRLVAVWSTALAAVIGCAVLSSRQVWYWADSISLFKRVSAIYPDLALPYNNIGSALLDRGQFEEAILSLKTALRLQPDYVDAHNNYGLCLWRLGRDQLALEQFKAVLNEHGPDGKALYNMGVVLFHQGKLDEAKACFAGALRLTPASAEAHNNLGNVLASQGKRPEAVREFESAIACAPDLVEARYNLARCFGEMGDPQQAIAHYVSALRIKPDYLEARIALARMLERTGQLAEAAGQYAAALELQPNLVEAHNNLSNLAAQLNNPKEALSHAQEAVRLKPDWAEPHYNLANALFLGDKLQGAVDQYREALRLKPDYPEVRQNFGFALEKLGQYGEATEQYRQLLKARPDFAAAYERLASVLAKQSNFAEAIKTAEEGLRLANASNQKELAQELQKGLQEYQAKVGK
ncbi:MAG: hypothetical protein C5B50_23195 [Verrucomicrobia bacterium]|nr:MAG: hypothetical protein C5B50_23195 [Verrucomicrobiota bacterium]